MAIPLLAAAAIKAAPALFSAGYKFLSGNKQVKDGKRLEKENKFTNYVRPNEATEALNLAERNYRNGMPGSDLYENRINSSAGTAFSAASNAASSSGDVLDAATKINMNTNRAMQDLGVQEDNFTQMALGQYTDQLGKNAAYSDKEFSYNIDQPYQRRAAAASALIGAGNQNKYSGIDDAMGIVTDAARIGLNLPEQTMGGKLGIPKIPLAKTVGVTNNGALSNPSLMGKWIVDPQTGAKRWSING
jgi:hypothetical protein